MDIKTGMLLVCRKEFLHQVPLANIWSTITGDSNLEKAYIHDNNSAFYQYSKSRPLFYVEYEPFYLKGATFNYIHAIVGILESCQNVIFIANPFEKSDKFDVIFPIIYANEIGIEVECRLESEFTQPTEEQET